MRKKKLLSTMLAFSLAMSMIPAAMAYDGKTEVEEPEDYGIMLIDDETGADTQTGESNGYDTKKDSTAVSVTYTENSKETTKYYDSFSEALKYINKTSTGNEHKITLYKSITNDGVGTTWDTNKGCGAGRIAGLSGKTLTIDLNNQSIALSDSTYSAFSLKDGAKLILTGKGTISSNKTVVSFLPDSNTKTAHTNSEVDIGSDVTIQSSNVCVNFSCEENATGEAANVYATAKISGKLELSGNQDATSGAGATVNVYGSIKGGNIDIIVNESAGIYGGKNTTGNYTTAGMYIAGKADVTVKADADGKKAVIEGYSGILIKGGNVTVNGGEIKGLGDPAVAYVGTAGKFGETGDAIAIANESDVYARGSLTISGGTITSAKKNAVAAYAKDGQTKPTVTIAGGTFSTDPRKQGEVSTDSNNITYTTTNFTYSKAEGSGKTNYGVKKTDHGWMVQKDWITHQPTVEVADADDGIKYAPYKVSISDLKANGKFTVQVSYGSNYSIFYLTADNNGKFELYAGSGAKIIVANGEVKESTDLNKYGFAQITVGR